MELTRAVQDNVQKLRLTWNHFFTGNPTVYEIDLSNLTQKNEKSGMVRQMRAVLVPKVDPENGIQMPEADSPAVH